MRRSTGQDGDRSFWDRHAASYDRSMLVLGRPLFRALPLVMEEVRGLEVLEVAAGTGLVTAALARSAARVVATDYSAAMVERLRDRVRREGLANVECLERDLYRLGFAPASFDAVACANVLHLVPDLPAALAALRSVLRPGGRIVAPTYCHGETALARVLSRLASLGGFPVQRRLTARSLRSSIEETGFHVYRVETLAGIVPIAFVAGSIPA